MNSTKARGKVLVCRHAESSTESKLAKSTVVKEAGGVGMVLIDEADQDVAIPFLIPSAIVGKEIGNKILSYINGTRFVFISHNGELSLLSSCSNLSNFVMRAILPF